MLLRFRTIILLRAASLVVVFWSPWLALLPAKNLLPLIPILRRLTRLLLIVLLQLSPPARPRLSSTDPPSSIRTRRLLRHHLHLHHLQALTCGPLRHHPQPNQPQPCMIAHLQSKAPSSSLVLHTHQSPSRQWSRSHPSNPMTHLSPMSPSRSSISLGLFLPLKHKPLPQRKQQWFQL